MFPRSTLTLPAVVNGAQLTCPDRLPMMPFRAVTAAVRFFESFSQTPTARAVLRRAENSRPLSGLLVLAPPRPAGPVASPAKTANRPGLRLEVQPQDPGRDGDLPR